MKRWLVLLTVLSLLLLIVLPACGGGGGKKTPTLAPTPSVTATPTPTGTVGPTPTATFTSIVTPTPTSTGPVKIGVIEAWSGPMAMAGMLADQIIAVVQMQLTNMGGILGGREVEFVKGDDDGTVAGTSAQATKLILDDKVAILTVGGESVPQFAAVADTADELKVPYLGVSSILGVAARKYSACLEGVSFQPKRAVNFTIEYLKPKTVAVLGYDSEDTHYLLDGVEDSAGLRAPLKAAGITIVSEQYFPQDAMDLSPYLTKIKYANPDLLVTFLSGAGQAITINKQIAELGGWGRMKYFCVDEPGAAKAAITIPSAIGTYVGVNWLPGNDEPGMKAFGDSFKEKYNRLPTSELTYYYNCFWGAIKAIELAGTDNPDKIAQAMRSGNLEWDSAWGPLRIGTDGIGISQETVAQIQEGGTLVKVWPQ